MTLPTPHGNPCQRFLRFSPGRIPGGSMLTCLRMFASQKRMLPLTTALAVLLLAMEVRAQVTLSLQASPASPGGTTLLSLQVNHALDLAGADLVISGPDFILPGSAETTPATTDFLIASRSQAGRIQIAMARAKGLADAAVTLVQVPLFIAKTAPVGACPLTVESVRFYSATPAVLSSQAVTGSVVVIAPAADLDGDGMADSWESRYFATTEATAGTDFDRDGISNLQEFIAGTDPASSASVFRILDLQRANPSSGSAPWLEWEAQAGRSYAVEWSDGPLSAGMAWHRVYSPTFHTAGTRMSWFDDGTRTHVEPANVQERYYRIVVIGQ
jgi:hypothetical protein